MNNVTTYFNLKTLKTALDWKLLLFLVLFLNVKLAVKIPAIAIIYILQWDFNFKFSFKNSRLPLFYPLIIVLGIVDLILNKNYTNQNYILVFLTGLGFWFLCILAIHQVKLSVERNTTDTIYHTIIVFFALNAIISLLNLAAIIRETGALNPYTYQGEYQKYFIGTGDYIKGLTFDTSTTNAVLNAFGVIYFLSKKNAVMLLTCMAVMLFTGSNSLDVLMLLIFALLFIFKSTKDQKSLIAVCLMFLVVFMAKISPQNNEYVLATFNNILHKSNTTVIAPPAAYAKTQTPVSLLNPEQQQEQIAHNYIDSINSAGVKPAPVAAIQQAKIPVIETKAGRVIVPKPDINSAPYQSLVTTPTEEEPLVAFINTHKAVLPISGQPFRWTATPGKLIGMLQTVNFFKQHPAKIFLGDGMGNFSSKLAFRASSLGITGGYPPKYTYIGHDFLVNHLDLYLNFFSKRAGYHSLTNSPFSVYDQLFAEYGLLGLLLFCIYYLGFFARSFKTLTYGLPILVLTAAVLFMDYWFEQLSVLVFFELLLFLDIKESSADINPNYAHE